MRLYFNNEEQMQVVLVYVAPSDSSGSRSDQGLFALSLTSFGRFMLDMLFRQRALKRPYGNIPQEG